MASFENMSQGNELHKGLESSKLNSGDSKTSIPKEIGSDAKELPKFKDAGESKAGENTEIPKEIGGKETERFGLSQEVKDKLAAGGMSEGIIKECVQDKNGLVYLKDKQVRLDSAEKSKLAVPYIQKKLDVNGVSVIGNFPVFNSKFECVLPEGKIVATDFIQMKECTIQLQEAIKNNPKLAKKFTPQQLEQIRRGNPKISGYTWHHSEEKGKMQLVDAGQHSENKHIGGNAIWGAGKRNS